MLNTTARQNTTPRTVLVVEDEPTLATAIAQRITAEGWTARVAGDGASAVQAASQLRPDLVIMDIMLPVMDGLEATKRIVAERPVPVLILTARDDEADKVIGLGAGADDYMTKPFSMRELIARCKALLRRVERAKVIAKNSENEKLLDFGSMVIDPAQRIVTVNGEQVSGIFSEGTKSGSFAYNTPVGRSGTKLGVQYSANSVHIIDGDLEPMNVRGNSNSYGVSLTQPLIVTEHLKSDVALEYSRQSSKTDFLGIHWVDDTISGYTASFSMMNYGKSSVIFQKHGYRIGDWGKHRRAEQGFWQIPVQWTVPKGLQRWADADGTAGRTVEQYQLSAVCRAVLYRRSLQCTRL